MKLVTAERRADLLAALTPWVVARLLVLVAYVLVKAAADELTSGGTTPKLDQHLLAWDADWYDAIADRGYEALPAESVRFFPLFPYLGRALGVVLGGNQGLALVVIANLAALVAGMLVHRLALEETGDERLAQRATWAMALFPGAFVLAWGYAEALFLVAVLGAFLALRREAWWAVAALAGAAALTRPLGVFLVLPVAWVALRGPSARGPLLPRLAAVAAAPLGTLAYLVFATTQGYDLLDPLTEQSPYRGAFTDPLSRLADAVDDLVHASRLGDAVHPPMAILLIVLVIVLIRRWPLAYALYTVPVVLLSLSAESFNSLERYGLNAVPVVLAVATVTRRHEVERGALAVGAAGVVALGAVAWIGNYVP